MPSPPAAPGAAAAVPPDLLIPAYVLAGGKSSRFGSDKARAELQGMPLLVRLRNAVQPVVSAITVVAEHPGKYRDLGLRTIVDRTPGLGPIGGLQAALLDAYDTAAAASASTPPPPPPQVEPGWILLLSCDLLVVQPHWVQALLAHRSASADVVAFRSDRWQPLLALYHQRILTRVDEHIARRQLAMWRLIEASRAVPLPLPHDCPRLPQANTPHDLRAAAASQQPQDKIKSP